MLHIVKPCEIRSHVTSIFKMRALVLHLVTVTFFFITWRGILQLGEEVIKTLKSPLGLETRFLTNWNFAIQTLLFIGYLLHDILELCKLFGGLRKKLKQNLDFYFYSISAPLSFGVAIVFWSMYIYNPSLMFPPLLKNIMPLWINHAIHTVIVINVLLQAYINKVSSVKLRKALSTYAILHTCYFICIYGTYFEKKVWIYPFLEKVEEPYRFLMLIFLFTFFICISITIHFCNLWYCDLSFKSKTKRNVDKKKRKS